MNKLIFQFIPVIVISIAITGCGGNSGNVGNNVDSKMSTKVADTSNSNIASGCECKESYQETCCEPPKDECDKCKTCEICPPCEEPCCTDTVKIGEPCNCAYNAPARIDPACGLDMWLTGTFIYWEAREKGLDLGYHFSSNNFKTINMDFDYKPGFKAGLGFSICGDDWTVYLEYTRLESENKRSIDISNYFNSSSNYLATIWLAAVTDDGSSTTYNILSSKWKLDYNTLDFELGRPFYLGKKLIFKPYCGLRGGWINQKYDLLGGHDYLSGAFTKSYSINKQDSWIIGPRGGLDADWLIGCNFRIFGSFAGSLNYQKFENSLKEVTPVQTGITNETIIKSEDDVSYVTPNIESGLGIGYGTYFCCDKWYFDLALSYDFQYYWNQNMMRHLIDGEYYLIDGCAGDLMLQGLTIKVELDF